MAKILSWIASTYICTSSTTVTRRGNVEDSLGFDYNPTLRSRLRRLSCSAALRPWYQCKCVLVDPVPMFNKTARAHIQAYVEIFEQPKQVAHPGISHVHHVWDRAMVGACRRHTLQLQRALRIHPDAIMWAQAAFWKLKSWCTFAPCAKHDIHNY